MRDMKNKFYRSLDLPKEESDVLRWYRRNIKQILDNAKQRTEIENNEE